MLRRRVGKATLVVAVVSRVRRDVTLYGVHSSQECVSDGPFTLQEEEVESIHYMTPEEILQRHEQGEKFTPDGIFALREYIKHKNG